MSAALLCGCEKVDSVLIEPEISLSHSNLAMLEGQMERITPIYSELGIIASNDEIPYEWTTSSASVATVSTGVVTAEAIGSTMIYASAYGYQSEPLVVNVVKDSSDLASITISALTATSLSPGDSAALSFEARTLNGAAYAIDTLTYNSSNTAVLEVTANGKVIAVGEGMAMIWAKHNGVLSNMLTFTVSVVHERRATLSGDHYSIQGNVKLIIDEEGHLILPFEDDFSSQNGPGLYIYLSNSNTGIGVIQQGIELGPLPQLSGAFEIDVTDLYPNVMIGDYQYVVVYCKPFTVSFGYGALD